MDQGKQSATAAADAVKHDSSWLVGIEQETSINGQAAGNIVLLSCSVATNLRTKTKKN